MSLASILERGEDHALKCDIRNSFAMLTDAGIARVCHALTMMSSAAATDAVIAIVGEQNGRAAALIPTLFGGKELADPEVAAKLFTGMAIVVGQPLASSKEVKAAIDAVPVPAPDKVDALTTIERQGTNAIEWAFVGRLLGTAATALLSRYLPILRYATVAPSIIKGAGTVAGAVFGATRSTEGQSYLPPGSR